MDIIITATSSNQFSDILNSQLSVVVMGFFLSLGATILWRYADERKRYKELLANFGLELTTNNDDSTYNIANTFQPELELIKLESSSVEELIKTKNFPKNWKDEDKKRVRCILKLIRDINRGILFRESYNVRERPTLHRVPRMKSLFEHETELIVDLSQKLTCEILQLDNSDLRGLGHFLKDWPSVPPRTKGGTS